MRGRVGHVAAVVLQEDAAAADHAPRIAHAQGDQDRRQPVNEQVGVQAGAERPVAAPLPEDRPVERHVGGQAESVPRNIFQSMFLGVISRSSL